VAVVPPVLTPEPEVPTPASPFVPLVLPDPVSVTAEPVTGVNGMPGRELAPAEEASRIIEAVVAHVTAHRREMGVQPRENRNHAATGEPAPASTKEADAKPEAKSNSEGQPATQTVTTTEAASAKTSEEEPSEGAKEQGDEDKSGAKSINFVRRWFVGRSQS
jgi:hypothetical protein